MSNPPHLFAGYSNLTQPKFTCSKLTIETLEQGVKQGANGIVLVSLFLTWTYFTPCTSVFIVHFEHVIAGWVFRLFSPLFPKVSIIDITLMFCSGRLGCYIMHWLHIIFLWKIIGFSSLEFCWSSSFFLGDAVFFSL